MAGQPWCSGRQTAWPAEKWQERSVSREEGKQQFLQTPTVRSCSTTAHHSLVFFNVLVSFLEALRHDFLFDLLLILLLLLLLPQTLFDSLRQCFSGWPPDMFFLRFSFTGGKFFDWKPVARPIKRHTWGESPISSLNPQSQPSISGLQIKCQGYPGT